MKKLFIAGGLAGTLTLTLAAASIATSNDPRTLPDAPQSLKCAIYKGEPGVRHHTAAEVAGRECETYWANDTAEDERELAQARKASAPASGRVQ